MVGVAFLVVVVCLTVVLVVVGAVVVAAAIVEVVEYQYHPATPVLPGLVVVEWTVVVVEVTVVDVTLVEVSVEAAVPPASEPRVPKNTPKPMAHTKMSAAAVMARTRGKALVRLIATAAIAPAPMAKCAKGRRSRRFATSSAPGDGGALATPA